MAESVHYTTQLFRFRLASRFNNITTISLKKLIITNDNRLLKWKIYIDYSDGTIKPLSHPSQGIALNFNQNFMENLKWFPNMKFVSE